MKQRFAISTGAILLGAFLYAVADLSELAAANRYLDKFASIR